MMIMTMMYCMWLLLFQAAVASNCQYEPQRFTFCGLPKKGKYNSLFCQDLACPLLHYCPGDGKKYPCTPDDSECCCSDSGQTCLEQAQQLLVANGNTTSLHLQFLPNFTDISERIDNISEKLINSINWTEVFNPAIFNRSFTFISFQNETEKVEPTFSPTIEIIPTVDTLQPTSMPTASSFQEETPVVGTDEPTSIPTSPNPREGSTARSPILPESEQPTSIPTTSGLSLRIDGAEKDVDGGNITVDEVEDSGR